MLPEMPEIVKCGHCSDCYWLEEAISVGSVPWTSSRTSLGASARSEAPLDPAWQAAEHVGEPTLDELFAAIPDLSKRRPERDARIIAWRRSNNPFRGPTKDFLDKVEPPFDPDRATENLQALVPLLTGKEDEQQLLRAEALRQLRRFDEALVVLTAIASGPYASVVRQIRSYCDAKDSHVRELECEHA